MSRPMAVPPGSRVRTAPSDDGEPTGLGGLAAAVAALERDPATRRGGPAHDGFRRSRLLAPAAFFAGAFLAAGAFFAAAFFAPAAFFAVPPLGHRLAADGEQLVGPLGRHRLEAVALAERGVGLAVGDVHAERRPWPRPAARSPGRCRTRAAGPWPPGSPPPRWNDLRLGEDRQRLVEGDREQLLLGVDVAVVLALLHVRPVATVVGDDRPRRRPGRRRACGAATAAPSASSSVIRSSVIVLNRLDHLRLVEPGRRVVGVAPLHVRAVAAVLGEHRAARRARRSARRSSARPAARAPRRRSARRAPGRRGRWRCPRRASRTGPYLPGFTTISSPSASAPIGNVLISAASISSRFSSTSA